MQISVARRLWQHADGRDEQPRVVRTDVRLQRGSVLLEEPRDVSGVPMPMAIKLGARIYTRIYETRLCHMSLEGPAQAGILVMAY